MLMIRIESEAVVGLDGFVRFGTDVSDSVVSIDLRFFEVLAFGGDF
jgi:hypothetical protein